MEATAVYMAETDEKLAKLRADVPEDVRRRIKVLAAKRELTMGEVITEMVTKGISIDEMEKLYP